MFAGLFLLIQFCVFSVHECLQLGTIFIVEGWCRFFVPRELKEVGWPVDACLG